MSTRIRLPLVGCCLALSSSAMAASATTWPEVKAPPYAKSGVIAEQMLLNGRPTRLERFTVRSTDAEVLEFYRAEFGSKRFVENRIKSDAVIASRQGNYFVTVQLHAVDGSTIQGTVMTTQMIGPPATSAVLQDTRKMLPSDTQVVSTVQTDDADKRSLVVVATNRNSARANRDRVVDAFRERGFRLTTDSTSGSEPSSPVSLQLSSPEEEAVVTISDSGTHRSIVINRVRGSK